MYKNLVVLDKKAHSNLKIKPIEDLLFAKESTFLPIIANEVSQIASVFPVVFTSDEAPALVTLVSFGTGNFAITKEGKWIANYVPSYLRKYPFSLASTKENPEQKIIMIDDASDLVSKSKGKQLFKKSGEQSETLIKSIEFLTSHEKQTIMTQNVVKTIADAGILKDSNISLGEGDDKKTLVQGFKIVDRKKLYELSDTILAQWVRNGIIALIEEQLKSLQNIKNLFNIANQREN